jgi:putative transposase
MEKKIDFETISKEIAEQIRSGKPLTGKDGAFTPLIKQVIEAALEGEMDEHLRETRDLISNRRNGWTRKNLKSSLGGIEIFSPAIGRAVLHPILLPSASAYFLAIWMIRSWLFTVVE